MANETLVITKQHIAEICSEVGIDFLMDETINALEHALRSYDENVFQIKKREGYCYTTPAHGLLEWMPIYVPHSGIAIKLVGYHPNNPDNYQLSTIQAMMCNFDISTGKLLMLCEGNFATALRTGAASAIASKYLAKADSTVLGLIGCGAQAVTQLHALSRVFKIEKVLIHDIDKDTEDNFAARVSSFIHVEIFKASTDEIEIESDVICTATSVAVGAGPVMKGDETKKHVHINAIGADFKGKFELPKRLLENSFVCPDFLDQAIEEGECQQLSQKQIGNCLHEIIKNPFLYEQYKARKTVFDSTGFALEDYVVMEVIKQVAKRLGRGLSLNFTDDYLNPKNPYSFQNRSY